MLYIWKHSSIFVKGEHISYLLTLLPNNWFYSITFYFWYPSYVRYGMLILPVLITWMTHEMFRSFDSLLIQAFSVFYQDNSLSTTVYSSDWCSYLYIILSPSLSWTFLRLFCFECRCFIGYFLISLTRCVISALADLRGTVQG